MRFGLRYSILAKLVIETLPLGKLQHSNILDFSE